VDGSNGQRQRRAVTPAVLGSAAFTAACAIFAIVFVAARGGLQMPVAATLPPVAVASAASTDARATDPPPTIAPTPETTATAVPPSPTAIPTSAPTPAPTFALPTLRPNDPLATLPECPDHPGCFEYLIQRGDTLSGVADRFLVPIPTILALNPELSDPGLIVTGTILYLGVSPFARLDPCPDAEPCSLYVVVAGDSLADIAARYGLTRDRILAINPGLARPIVAGQVIRLPHPA
jgi:nucleoid-associated protein YgaU